MSATSFSSRKGKSEVDSTVKLSKSLSWLLRHGAEKEGLQLLEGGFLKVQDILLKKQFSCYTEEDIRRVVSNNVKKRFTLKEDEESGCLLICANQGHSVQVEGLDLTPLTDSKDWKDLTAVHGTYYKFWDSIKKQGLSRMNRNHIHFAPGEPGDSGVISGMRSSCDILIYINLEEAIHDGLEFFTSSNNVILCAGDKDGFLSPKYFKQVLDRKTRQSLL